jgi:hypothetical protein
VGVRRASRRLNGSPDYGGAGPIEFHSIVFADLPPLVPWGQSVSIVRRNVDNAGLSRRAVFKSERGQVKVFGTLREPSHGRGVFGA